MGPPRERGGEDARGVAAALPAKASMGPPRERGGERLGNGHGSGVSHQLQWGRRANAAESADGAERVQIVRVASMGPPRERGGE